MTTTPKALSTSIWRKRAAGLLFAAAIGLVAMWLARLPALQSVGLSALPLAIILGIVCAQLRRATGGVLAPMLTHFFWGLILVLALPPMFGV